MEESNKHDANNVLIFEGDVLRIDKPTLIYTVAIIKDGEIGIFIDGIFVELILIYEKIEIIGNIYNITF